MLAGNIVSDSMFMSMVEVSKQAESDGSTSTGFNDVDPETGPIKHS